MDTKQSEVLAGRPAAHADNAPFGFENNEKSAWSVGFESGYDAARLEIASLQAQLEAVGAGGVGRLVRGAVQDAPSIVEFFVSVCNALTSHDLRWQEHAGTTTECAVAAIKRITDQAQEDAEVQRNSARYLRIRNGPYSDQYGDLYAMRFEGDGDVPTKGSDLDAAVDAAIAAQQGGPYGN